MKTGRQRLNIKVIQPEYPNEGTSDSAIRCLAWMLDALEKAGRDSDLILLPEYANVPGIGDRDRMLEFALSGGVEMLEQVARCAAHLESWVAVGAAVLDGSQWVNRTILFDRGGGQWYGYDKVHLTEVEDEGLGFTAGPVPGLTSLEGTRVGFATCFDVYFPEYFSALTHRGVDLVLSPSYQRSESPERLRAISQTRAIDCGSWFARSSYAIPGRDTGGHSLIVSPEGKIVADAGGESGVICATIDPRQKFVKPRSHGQPDIEHGALIARHRRPGTYGVGE